MKPMIVKYFQNYGSHFKTVSAKLSFMNDGKIKAFLNKETLGTFSTYRA